MKIYKNDSSPRSGEGKEAESKGEGKKSTVRRGGGNIGRNIMFFSVHEKLSAFSLEDALLQNRATKMRMRSINTE